MSNFTILDKDNLSTLLEPFAPGMSPHITPIKYEVLTPDLFCLLFRTTDKNNQDHYFVLLEYDYVKDLENAKHIIQKWHGKVLDFLPPVQAKKAAETLAGLSYKYTKIYYGLLAKVARPKGTGYWASNIVIMPGDDVESKLSKLPPKQAANAKKLIKKIREPDTAISVYAKPEGGIELFYNHLK